MSRDPEEVSKLTESIYKNVMEQFNPGLRNLVNLGKSYEKSVAAMALAGKVYFEAVSKIGENAAVSPVSRELGVVLMEISEVHKKILLELEENFKGFHKEIIAELERKTDMDVKYINATFKRYQTEHRMKTDSLERSQSELKKLRRKSQGKSGTKYETKENECLETLTSRQMEMQKFVAEGCREALLEEKRRFCFLVDKHCTFSYQIAAFHDKSKETLTERLPTWQDKCGDATNVPNTVVSMIDGLRTPMSFTPLPSPLLEHNRKNSDAVVPPPAPPLKPQTSPLASMFIQDRKNSDAVVPPPAPLLKPQTSPLASMFIQDRKNSDAVAPPPAPPLMSQTSPLASMFIQDTPKAPVPVEKSLERHDSVATSPARPVPVSTGVTAAKKPQVQTIFPHNAENNDTLLSFEEGDIITLLIPDERDGWLYGEMNKTKQRGWFPSSYCRPYTASAVNSSVEMSVRSKSVANLVEQEQAVMVLPPPDYSNSPARNVTHKASMPSADSKVSQQNGTPTPLFLGGGNPFVAVKLRPTVTNDRSAPII